MRARPRRSHVFQQRPRLASHPERSHERHVASVDGAGAGTGAKDQTGETQIRRPPGYQENGTVAGGLAFQGGSIRDQGAGEKGGANRPPIAPNDFFGIVDQIWRVKLGSEKPQSSCSHLAMHGIPVARGGDHDFGRGQRISIYGRRHRLKNNKRSDKCRNLQHFTS